MPKIYRLIVITISMMLTPLYAADIPEFLASADSEIEVVLRIVDNVPGDVSMASISNLKISRTEKHQMLVNHLKGKVDIAQSSLLDVIKTNREKVQSYKSFWISNAVYIKGDPDFIRQLVMPRPIAPTHKSKYSL